MNHRERDYLMKDHGVTVITIGKTKVHGEKSLSYNLAASLLNRHLTNKHNLGEARFTPTELRFYDYYETTPEVCRRIVPYTDVNRLYSFHGLPGIFMLCIQETRPEEWIYASFRTRHPTDVQAVKSFISTSVAQLGEVWSPFTVQTHPYLSNPVYTVDQPTFAPSVLQDPYPPPMYPPTPPQPPMYAASPMAPTPMNVFPPEAMPIMYDPYQMAYPAPFY